MFTFKKNNPIYERPGIALVLQFLFNLLLAIAISVLVQEGWTRNLNLYHTILEVTCVFIALSIFTTVWYTYDKGGHSNYILGFGYLTVAIFDISHTYYHLKLDLTALSYFDLSTRFWILGRLAEAVTLLLVAFGVKTFTSKYMSILITIGVSAGIAYFVVVNHEAFPLLLTEQGVTHTKIFLEYGIMAIFLASLFGLRHKLNDKGKISYKHICISILLSICAEFCFTTYILISNISWTLGHILKIISYFYLFKGSFISTLRFAYDELDRKHKNLEATNIALSNMTHTMKDILDALPIAVQKYDPDGRLKYTNKKFDELLQCNSDEIENLSILEIVNIFASKNISEEEMLYQLSKPNGIDTVKSFRTLKGENIKLSIKSSKIRNGNLFIFTDAKKDQELQNLNIQTQTILNSINNGVMIFDEHRQVVLCNKVFEDICDIDSGQIIGMNIDHLKKCIAMNIVNDEDCQEGCEVSITTFRGSKKDIRVYVSPIKNVKEEVIGRIVVGTDITEQKKEQLRMIQQEKLALLGQMGAGIVHETRNFLTTIKGRCQLIDIYTEDEVIRNHSSKINKDVEAVNHIMSEFLFLSKPKDTNLVEISIRDVLGSIKGMVETTSLVRGVKLEMKMCEDERYLLCDESQLKQVILNICKNGIDAMINQPNAKLVLETSYCEYKNAVLIIIKDNGKGISKEHLDKIGTPFFTTKRAGTGLGLSVCYKIIRDHGGKIEVESELGKGTSFTIELPCVEDEEMEDII